MDNRMELDYGMVTKWLRVLMYTAIVSLVKSLLGYLPIWPGQLSTWISWGIMLVMTVTMLLLAPANGRYRTAGILRGVMLACALFTSLVMGSTLLTLAASVASIIGIYYEYSGHAELIGDRDSRFSGKWHTLFTWSIIISVLISFISTALAVILVLALPETRVATVLSARVIAILRIPQAIIDIIYIVYIGRMVKLFQAEAAL